LRGSEGECFFDKEGLTETKAPVGVACQIMARFIALVYNWWLLFTGPAIPEKHAESITMETAVGAGFQAG
jgi:hypothetical protein